MAQKKSAPPNQKHVLLCVVGGTPAVVTETVYALMVEKRIPLQRLRIITTTHGRTEVERQLLRLTGEETGGWHLLRRDYPVTQGIELDPAEDIIVPVNEKGQMLEDIRTTAENDLLTETLLTEANRWCSKENVIVHASVAGGRKTMSLFMGFAMQLVARSQDHLYHILVPPEYDGLPGFFYPTPKKVLLPNRQGIPIDASKARMDLAEIPFVRFRALLDGETIQSLAYRDLVVLAERRLTTGSRPVGIVLSLKSMTLDFYDSASGSSLASGPVQVRSETGLGLYYYLCTCRKDGMPRVNIFAPDEGPKRLKEIAGLVALHRPDSLVVERFERFVEEIAKSYTTNLSALRTNWNRSLREMAAQCGITHAEYFCIENPRINGKTYYGVPISPELIRLE